LIALLLTLNQRKNPFIKATDLARYEYQFLVLARKLSSPNMRRKHVLAAGLTQFVQGLAKRRSVTLKESFFALKICQADRIIHVRALAASGAAQVSIGSSRRSSYEAKDLCQSLAPGFKAHTISSFLRT
jgi:hypothetical protein